jgi:hypothetical protein
MDELLKTLADVALDVEAAEAALAEGAAQTAEDRLDTATAGLDDLRAHWPALGAAQRRVLGAAAAPVRERLDAARARVPKRVALSVAVAEADPDQEIEPDA